MPSLQPLEVYREYTVAVVRLMIHYTWSQARLGNNADPISTVLDQQVDIKRKTSFYKDRPRMSVQGPPENQWDLMRGELIERIEQHNASSTDALEDECWHLLAPYIEPVLDDTCPRSWLLRDRPYQCWSYELSDSEPPVIIIHIANAYQPESPFRAHRTDLIATLLQLLLDVRDSHPEVTTVQCGSWLNDFPAFLDLFPVAWKTSMIFRDTCRGNWGWWGQYMTHDGAFHEKNASVLRNTGRHPHRSGRAQCSVDDAIEHLGRMS